MSRTDIYVVVIVLLAAYGLGVALGNAVDYLSAANTPPTIYKRVHIVTNAGCRL